MDGARRQGTPSQLYKNKHTSQLDVNSPPKHELWLAGNKTVAPALFPKQCQSERPEEGMVCVAVLGLTSAPTSITTAAFNSKQDCGLKFYHHGTGEEVQQLTE